MKQRIGEQRLLIKTCQNSCQVYRFSIIKIKPSHIGSSLLDNHCGNCWREGLFLTQSVELAILICLFFWTLYILPWRYLIDFSWLCCFFIIDVSIQNVIKFFPFVILNRMDSFFCIKVRFVNNYSFAAFSGHRMTISLFDLNCLSAFKCLDYTEDLWIVAVTWYFYSNRAVLFWTSVGYNLW